MRSALLTMLFVTVVLGASALEGCTADDTDAFATPAPTVALARGVVDVDGGLVAIRAQRNGQLIETTVTLGQQVTRGAILAKLNGATEQAEADAALADLQRARAELIGTRSRLASLEEQLSRVREAVELGAESGRVRDELQGQVDVQMSAVPVAEAALQAAEARGRAARTIAESTLVRAPADGRIVQVNAHRGDVVSSIDGPAIFLLRPYTALIVRASIPARDVARVHGGSTVSVAEVDGNGASYSGRVTSIGELARKPDPAVSIDDFASERVVDCVIQLDPLARIRVGSLVLVSAGIDQDRAASQSEPE